MITTTISITLILITTPPFTTKAMRLHKPTLVQLATGQAAKEGSMFYKINDAGESHISIILSFRKKEEQQ